MLLRLDQWYFVVVFNVKLQNIPVKLRACEKICQRIKLNYFVALWYQRKMIRIGCAGKRNYLESWWLWSLFLQII